MVKWGVVATVKAPEEQVLAFIAHHLALGAAHVWIYFDDPADPAHARVSRLRNVTARRCTGWYWAIRGGRHEKLHNRQITNAIHAQRKCKLDWLAHIDSDEFLYAPRPIAELLAEVPSDVPNVLMDAFEAMHDPDLPDDIFTARQFRGPLGPAHPALHAAIFGPVADVVAKGNLGHTIGKSFCRIGVPGVRLGLHEVFTGRTPLVRPFHPSLRVLHFHAHDPVEWRRLLPHRLTGGAYHYDAENHLRSHLKGASDAVIADFYRHTMITTPEKAALLEANGLLITTNLGLRAKVADLLAGRP
ncbi:glycosyltransferase family 2 protein [Tabrizicola aquatica]|uniref:glycosyltransferase family 2 protein n=1 Tax=Tabrizicola aquatica TaxID=909926 RepID=UPI000CD1CEF4|nr:glycosyltransferase family 2 protein [Tabrizicola aquatica]